MLRLLRLVNWRHAMSRRGRTLLTVGGIALGVAMVMAVFVLNQTITSAYGRLFSGLAGASDIEVAALSGAGFDERLLLEVAEIDGVAAAVPSVRGNSHAFFGEQRTPVFVLGVEGGPEEEALRAYALEAGRLLKPGDEGALLLPASLATDFGVEVGDDVGLLATTGVERFRVVGLLDPVGPGLVNAGQVAVLPLDAAQRLLGKQGRIDQIGIALELGADRDRVIDAARQAAGSGVRVGEPETGKAVQDVLGGVNLLLFFASGISLFAAFFLIYNNVAMAMTERRREHGILVALGLVRRVLFASVLVEAVAMSLIGGAVGVVLGAGLAEAMVGGLSDTLAGALRLEVGRITVDPSAAALAVAVGLMATIAATLLPARHGTNLAPVEVLRPKAAAPFGEKGREGAVGLAFLLLSAALLFPSLAKSTPSNQGVMVWPLMFGIVSLFLGATIGLASSLRRVPQIFGRPFQWVFGVSGVLASGNLARSPARTSATVGALLVAVSMLVGVTSLSLSYRSYLRQWIENEIGWDLLVASSWRGLGAETPLVEGFKEELEALDDVDLASPERLTFMDHGDGRVFAAIFDMDEFGRFASFSVAEGPSSDEVIAAVGRRDAVAISRTFAAVHGMGPGDELRLNAPRGELALTVAAVVDDMSSTAGGTIYLDRRLYKDWWNDDAVDGFAIRVRDGADLQQVRQRILERFGGDIPLTVQTNAEFSEAADRIIGESFSLILALVAAAVLVATFGVANTLVMSVVERRRELAELRALGATRRQVRRMVLGEGIGTGVIGGAVGGILGVLIAFLLVEANRRFMGLAYPLTLPWTLVVTAFGVGVAVTALASWGPARFAARLPIAPEMAAE